MFTYIYMCSSVHVCVSLEINATVTDDRRRCCRLNASAVLLSSPAKCLMDGFVERCSPCVLRKSPSLLSCQHV